MEQDLLYDFDNWKSGIHLDAALPVDYFSGQVRPASQDIRGFTDYVVGIIDSIIEFLGYLPNSDILYNQAIDRLFWIKTTITDICVAQENSNFQDDAVKHIEGLASYVHFYISKFPTNMLDMYMAFHSDKLVYQPR